MRDELNKYDKLVPLYSNFTLWSKLQEYFEDEIKLLQSSLEKTSDVQEIYRLQGSISMIRKFLKSRSYFDESR